MQPSTDELIGRDKLALAKANRMQEIGVALCSCLCAQARVYVRERAGGRGLIVALALIGRTSLKWGRENLFVLGSDGEARELPKSEKHRAHDTHHKWYRALKTYLSTKAKYSRQFCLCPPSFPTTKIGTNPVSRKHTPFSGEKM